MTPEEMAREAFKKEQTKLMNDFLRGYYSEWSMEAEIKMWRDAFDNPTHYGGINIVSHLLSKNHDS